MGFNKYALRPWKGNRIFSLLFHRAKAEEGTEMRTVKEEKWADRKKPLSTTNLLLSPHLPGLQPEPFLSLRPLVFASRNQCRDSQERVTSFGSPCRGPGCLVLRHWALEGSASTQAGGEHRVFATHQCNGTSAAVRHALSLQGRGEVVLPTLQKHQLKMVEYFF